MRHVNKRGFAQSVLEKPYCESKCSTSTTGADHMYHQSRLVHDSRLLYESWLGWYHAHKTWARRRGVEGPSSLALSPRNPSAGDPSVTPRCCCQLVELAQVTWLLAARYITRPVHRSAGVRYGMHGTSGCGDQIHGCLSPCLPVRGDKGTFVPYPVYVGTKSQFRHLYFIN